MLLGHKVVDVYVPPSDGDDAQGASGKNVILVPDAEGLYKSRRNHVVFTIERKDDKLIARGGSAITAISATSFRLMESLSAYLCVNWRRGRDSNPRYRC